MAKSDGVAGMSARAQTLTGEEMKLLESHALPLIFLPLGTMLMRTLFLSDLMYASGP
ncbi:hypothetical protein FHU10_2222 [Serratia fonticola]|jgi:hypothetical protein|uniref:Uncharacterized protein n=1 Tax=Serratia fonticola TaxID=47917 RepID=A0A542BGZ6_SERFO|nr:hypothetical protein [Serratia fonticola]TQI77810.1 hypothetical protein FHU09_0230 [Serratia fonticola]TQI95195.1 hypothetical protein FHU11_0563 [Serratia fonticola]TVZ69692.1 hypothetical protein FHU10_2222 [Serratia fonticola]